MECTRKLEEVKGKRYDDLEAVKLRNMVDMALGFSAMMRLNLCPALTPAILFTIIVYIIIPAIQGDDGYLTHPETGIKIMDASGMSRQASHIGALSLKPSRFFYWNQYSPHCS